MATTMRVKDLKKHLEEFDDDMPVLVGTCCFEDVRAGYLQLVTVKWDGNGNLYPHPNGKTVGLEIVNIDG